MTLPAVTQGRPAPLARSHAEPGETSMRCGERMDLIEGYSGYSGYGLPFSRMLDFTFPLQLKGTCLPQKNCFSLDLVYYMVGIA